MAYGEDDTWGNYEESQRWRRELIDNLRPRDPYRVTQPAPQESVPQFSGGAGPMDGILPQYRDQGRGDSQDRSNVAPPGARDAAISQVANVYANPSERINAQNPNAEAGKPYVQQGTTGGYLDGVGVTIGQGSSITPAQAAAYRSAAQGAGIDDAWINDFLARNPNDYNRITESYSNAPGGGGGGASSGGGGGGLGAGSGSGGGSSSPVDGYIQQMLSAFQADRARQDQERAEMRRLLLGQIGNASKPVDMNDPGISEILAAQRLASRRSADRSRREMAEGLASDDQLYRGSFDPRQSRIEQQRAESETGFIGDIMNRELTGRRNQLQSLMAMAVSMGDAESARALQGQLALIDGQLRQGQFNAQLGQNRYQFDNDFDLRRAFLESSNNANAANVLWR